MRIFRRLMGQADETPKPSAAERDRERAQRAAEAETARAARARREAEAEEQRLAAERARMSAEEIERVCQAVGSWFPGDAGGPVVPNRFGDGRASRVGRLLERLGLR